MEKDEINTIDAMSIPSASGENDDYRINCTDPQSLRDILNITLEQFSNLAVTVASNDTCSELLSLFSDSFKSSLQENVVINGLPFVPDKSNELSSPQNEENKQMILNELLTELSKTATKVASKRKYSPEQCCKILKIGQKHDLQNLKKAKLINLPASSSSTSITSSCNSGNLKLSEQLSSLDLNSVQEIVQHKLEQRQKVAMKLSLISDVNRSNEILLSANSHKPHCM